MKVIKPQVLSVLYRPFLADDRPRLCVTTLAMFGFHEPETLFHEAELWAVAADEVAPGLDVLDAGMPKDRPELVVDGVAHPPNAPQSACEVAVMFGSVDKRLVVLGDRLWDAVGAPTSPQPFTECRLSWEVAFGGSDNALNPHGRGTERREALPNVQRQGDDLTAFGGRVEPVSLGTLPLGHPQMRGFAGTYDERWQRERAPWLPIDFDLRAHQVCPPDQWLEGELHGDEPFVVKHLHPRVARLEGRLPGVRIRAWVSFEESGERLVEVPMRLDTVRLWPHRERGVIIHRGLLEVAETDAFDAKLLAVAAERLREGRSSEHYAHAVVGRLHPSRGAAATLDDRDLWNGRTGGAQDDEPPGVLRERLRARADRELDAARAQLAAHGLDPDQYGVPTALSPSTDAPVDPTDLDERLKEVEREGAALKAQAEQQMQRICADAGLDYDTLAAGSHDDASPPDFSAERVARDLAAQLEDAAASGAPQVTTAVDVAALRPTLDEVETLLAACYRRFAHLNTKPPTRPGSASAQLEGAARRGDRLDRVDYTGADVAGANLRGADLSGIYLAGANLRDADLREAKLEGAVLAHADLSGARLDCARLAGVNLGGARLVGATLAHAELRAATLVGAELTEVDVTGASLLACDLSRARFDQATGEGMRIDEGKSLEPLSLSSAKLPGLVVTRSLFVGLDALGADLGASTWERCALVDAVLDDAVLTEASFSETALTGASVLRGANLNAATLVSCTMRGVDAREATLQRAQLERVDWSHARLDRTDWYRAAARSCLFVRAALGEARLVSVNASESLFDRADLTGTDFTGALLYGASLEEVDLAAATFAHAEIGRALLRAPRRMGEGA